MATPTSLRTVLSAMLALFLVGTGAVQAQDQTVTGTVTDAQSGEALPGVNVTVPQTNVGTTTDRDGAYRLSVPETADSLAFSFVGYQRTVRAVGTRSEINVALQPAVGQLEDVVVTALGVEREERSLGYAVQQVDGAEIAETQETNLVSALQGQVAGAQITNTGGQPGSSSRIVLRGVTSLDPNADNQPLFVVDGVPVSNETFSGSRGAGGFAFSNGAVDINPENIESVSVLKGASAAALYGVRAANGAVVIETKDGQAGQTQVDYSSSVGFQRVGKIPPMQREFMDGWRGEFGFFGFPSFHAWGPKADTIQGSEFFRNYEDYFDRGGMGQNVQNSLAVSGGTEASTFRLSLNYGDQTGVIPEAENENFSARASGQLDVSDELRVSASAKYANAQGTKLPVDGQLGQLMYYPTSVSVVRKFKNEDGSQFSPLPFLNHPIFVAKNHNLTNDRDRFIGNIGVTYTPTDWFTAEYRFGNDLYQDAREEVIPGPLGVRENENAISAQGLLDRETITNRELTSTLRLSASRSLTDGLDAELSVGNDVFDSNFDRVNVTGENFGTPRFFDLSNTSNISTSEAQRERRVIGVYGDLSLNYEDYLFLTLTGRNDWSSTLPEGNRSFFYPSASLGFVFSDVVELPSGFDYGKLRLSASEVGKDARPYLTDITFGSFPFKGETLETRSGQLGDPNLKPETTVSFEIGADLRFLDERLRLDVTAYQSNSRDQIIPVPVSEATGFDEFVTNAGEIRNRGIELTTNIRAVETEDFTWDATVNWSKNNNEVVSIREGIESITLSGSSFSYGGSLTMQLRRQLEYGNLFGPVYDRFYENPSEENDFIVNEDRPRIISRDTGFPTRSGEGFKVIGNVQPDWTGSVKNTFSYQNFTLSALIDVKRGGDLYNQVAAFHASQGTLPITTNRDEEVQFEGVYPDGTPVDTTVVPGQDFYRNVYRRVAENFVEDASYVKLRNVRLTYRLPDLLTGNTPLRSGSIGVGASNILLWTPYDGFDPESRQFDAGSNTQGFQGLRTPAVESYTVQLNLSF
ncbi:MAG: SusC/RagA family TonB-linked outer membrane protein [Salinivenus sp.]